MSRKTCEVLAEIRILFGSYTAISSIIPKEELQKQFIALIEEAQSAVNRLTAAYEVGSEVRCPRCEVNGGMRIVRGCHHCGHIEEVKP